MGAPVNFAKKLANGKATGKDVLGLLDAPGVISNAKAVYDGDKGTGEALKDVWLNSMDPWGATRNALKDPKVKAPKPPPPGANASGAAADAYFRELARQATERQLRASSGRSAAFGRGMLAYGNARRSVVPT